MNLKIVTGSIVAGILVLAIVSHVSYKHGVTAGADMERDKTRQAFLDSNAVHRRRLEQLDHAKTALVVAADSAAAKEKRAASAARASEDSIRSRIVVVSDSTVSIDSQPPKPADPVLITALERGAERARLDSLAAIWCERRVAERDDQLRIKDERIANVTERSDTLAAQVVDLKVEVHRSKRGAFWHGMEVGAGATAALLGALAVVLRE